MKSFPKWFKDTYNEEMPSGEVNASWFDEHDLPLVVHCTCCEMTMCVASAYIDDDNYTYCSSCAGE